MTTCIWDGVSRVYCDTLSSGSTPTLTRKYRLLDDGNAIMIGSGNTVDIHRFYRCLQGVDLRELNSCVFSEFLKGTIEATVVIIRKETSASNRTAYNILHFTQSVHYSEFPNQLIAIGSGSRYALGAIKAGASIPEAIRIASEFDTATNNKLECYDLGQSREITL